jgi:hypothetical protein
VRLVRPSRRSGLPQLWGERNPRGSLLRPLALTAAGVAGIGALLRGVRILRAGHCEDDAREGTRSCARYEDRGYSACGRYEDRGYSACDRYEDRGYSACREWRKNCCDWWPCSWVCEVFSWFCFAWVWVSNVVCVLWVWISHLVCVLWVWISRLVCVLWVWVVYPVCVFICWLRRLFTGTEVSQSRSECIYGWTAAYQVTEQRDCMLAVVLRIRLQPDARVSAADLQNARTTWEQAIEQTWSGRFPIRRTHGDCPCESYRVTVDVQWVTSGEHHTVRVRAGSGRADMTNWFVTDTGGTAAHEAGHMLGNPDEYSDAACPNRNVTNDNSIMQTTSGTARPRHYQGFADWISARTCCDHAVAPD